MWIIRLSWHIVKKTNKGKFNMGCKKDLKDYISNNFSGTGFMSFIRENIRYIYEVGDVDLLDSDTHNARLIGIYAVGVFYSLSKEYEGIGKVFIEEFTVFEQLYNDVFDKQMKRYSAQNPIGGKIAMSVELRLKEFERSNLRSVASDLIFGSRESHDKPIDHNYFESLFLRYLLLGNRSLEDAVKADINENADELNYVMISEDMAYKYAAKMLRNHKLVEKVALYGTIKQSDLKKYIVTIDFEGTIIKNIEIEREQLLRMIKNDDTYTYKGRLIIHFEDVIFISNGKQTFYTKN